MANIKSINEIILNLIDYFKLVLPDLDTKPGSVSRDLFIDSPATQLSLLYNELSDISNKQSLRLVIGSDLDKLAKNFGVVRRRASAASGQAILTFSAINAPININRGDTLISNNGTTFTINVGTTVSPASSNFYRSVASRLREQLDFAGINDTFAVIVTAVASSTGISGNIGPHSLKRTTISGVSNITNIDSFNGGTDAETDTMFRNRILSTFSGSSVGTALGYLNTAHGITGVLDATVIEPGNSLMTRDGTDVNISSDGTRTIISEGSGGKVDVIVMGSNLVQTSDSYIYQDKSNNNDPTNIKNNVVLGQLISDVNKTINRKRIDNIASGTLPSQPISNIIQVTGSISGSNFTEKTIDSLGRVSGNYELIKDNGVYSGSPFGFDTFSWVSNKVSLFSEDKIKGQFNGQDTTTFSDVLEIPKIQQTISINSENSTVTEDRSIIQLLHTPATNVTRVFNVNTGERYLITKQNLDQTGALNTTGRIQISGNTLPFTSDTLQVDYNWIIDYDQYSDYDGLVNSNNIRGVSDSVDWGLSSAIHKEKILFSRSVGNNFFTGTTTHTIDKIISAVKFLEIDGVVTTVLSGTYTNRLSIILRPLPDNVISVDSVTIKNTNTEIYKTFQNESFTISTEIIGINIFYVCTIILPTDTAAKNGDNVTVIINNKDVFSTSTISGSSSNTQITIPSTLVNTAANNIILNVTYLSNITDIMSSGTTSLPASRFGNGFILNNNNGFNNFSPVNISKIENQIVQQNLSNQKFVELSIQNSEFNLLPSQIISIIRLSDGYELWNNNHLGSISTSSSGNYQLILSGFNAPTISDRVLVVYYASDIKRTQPFSYYNTLIKKRSDLLSIDPGTGKLTIPINSFINQTNLSFKIIEPNTDLILLSASDGYLTNNGNGTAQFSSTSINFSNIVNLLHKKIIILSPTSNCNNDGLYDIMSYTPSTNIMNITNIVNNITNDNISVIRLIDGKEIWDYNGVIDVSNNKLLLPATAGAVNERVIISLFTFGNLKSTPTRIIANIFDQVTNAGAITINGTSIFKADSIIFTSTNSGLKLNLSEALRKVLKLKSTDSLPLNVRIAKIIKLEKVITASPSDDSILKQLVNYDTKNTIIQNNLLFTQEMLSNKSLQSFECILPNTANNLSLNNLPNIGDKLKVTFYYTIDNDNETLTYTKNGTLYTNKKFALINKIYVSSGFKSSESTRLSTNFFTQPIFGSRYKMFYDYVAPKHNERITINYNYNKLISDVTFGIENTRPINSDVLVKEANEVLIDLTMNVVIDSTMLSSTSVILQKLRNQLLTSLTSNKLNTIIDQHTLINIAQSIEGISRARILFFNKNGSQGQVLKIRAQENEFLSPNKIIINTEVR